MHYHLQICISATAAIYPINKYLDGVRLLVSSHLINKFLDEQSCIYLIMIVTTLNSVIQLHKINLLIVLT